MRIKAILAARAAFGSFTTTAGGRAYRAGEADPRGLQTPLGGFRASHVTEMGAPMAWARGAQFWAGEVHIGAAVEAGEKMEWE
jgi:aldehyde dehydrogenase (NAD+)